MWKSGIMTNVLSEWFFTSTILPVSLVHMKSRKSQGNFNREQAFDNRPFSSSLHLMLIAVGIRVFWPTQRLRGSLPESGLSFNPEWRFKFNPCLHERLCWDKKIALTENSHFGSRMQVVRLRFHCKFHYRVKSRSKFTRFWIDISFKIECPIRNEQWNELNPHSCKQL